MRFWRTTSRNEWSSSEAVNVEIEGRRTSEDMLVMGSTVLIGQTILERLDFLVDCPGQRILPKSRARQPPYVGGALDVLMCQR